MFEQDSFFNQPDMELPEASVPKIKETKKEEPPIDHWYVELMDIYGNLDDSFIGYDDFGDILDEIHSYLR